MTILKRRNRSTPFAHRTFGFAVGVWALLLASSALAQGPSDPWFMRSPRPKDFEVPKVALGGFTIELPKEWQLARGFNTFLLIVTEKTKSNLPGASIIVERWQLADSLDVNDMLATYLRDEYLKKRETTVQTFNQELKDVAGRKIILTRYTREGVSGQDAVVDYSMPIGKVLYRVTGIAPTSQVSRYQSTFAHVAFSLKASD